MVYLLHFSTPLSQGPDPRTGRERAARHYLGSTDDLETRLDDHAHGNGARLMQVCAERGITFTLARTWKGGREVERRLKDRHESPRLCPICKSEKGESHDRHRTAQPTGEGTTRTP